MRLSLLAITLFVTICVLAFPANAVTYDFVISGEVQGTTSGAPIPNHLIEINSLDPGQPISASTHTDLNGFFSITLPFNVGTSVPLRISTHDLCDPGHVTFKDFPSHEGSINIPFYLCDSVVYASCKAEFSFLLDTSLTSDPNAVAAVFQDNSSTQIGTITDWNWDFGNSNGSLLQNPTEIYDIYPANTYNVCLSIYTDSGCVNTSCSPVHISDTLNNSNNCEADFVIIPEPPNPGSPDYNHYNFVSTSSSNGNIVSYWWNFGDGIISTDANPSHMFYNLIADTFKVCLLIFTDDSCSSVFCQDVIISGNVVQPDCQSFFTHNADTLNNFSFGFEDLSSSINTIIYYKWDFGDGDTSLIAEPIHQFPGMGVYNVCLTIKTDNGCESTFCDFVYVDTLPPTQCLADFEYGAQGTSDQDHFFDMSSSLGSNVVQWIWSFGDGSISQVQNPIHTYSTTGYYNVCLTIYTDKWCSSNFCKTIFFDAELQYCEANFTHIYNNPGSFLDISFTDLSDINSVQWFWDFGDGSTSTLQNPNHIYSTSGIYNVCLDITTGSNCTNTHCAWIQAEDTLSTNTCLASFAYGGINGAFEEGHFYDVSYTTSPIIEWSWNFGDGTVSALPNPLHFFSTTGWHTVCLDILTTDSCSSSFCDSVYFEVANPVCEALFTSKNMSTIHTPYYVSFTDASAASNTILEWDWSFGNGLTSNLQSPDSICMGMGTYMVCLEITTIDGCQSNYCKEIKVSAPDTLFDVAGEVIAKGTSVSEIPVLLLSKSGDIYKTNSDNGYYLFEDVPADTFITYVLPNANTYSGYAPTYHSNSLFWETADEIIVDQDRLHEDIHMKAYNTPTGGLGTIHGGITWINSTGTNTYLDRTDQIPENINILLFNWEDSLLSYTKSDINGVFSFGQLPWGNYKIDMELTGYLTIPVKLTLSESHPTSTSSFFTIRDGVAFIGVSEPEEWATDIKVYPNPAQNKLYLELPNNTTEDFKIDVNNSLGQKLKLKLSNIERNKIVVDVEALPAGIYYVKMTDKSKKQIVKKFIK